MSVKLGSFSIGEVRIGFPAILAAMAGYTDAAYRLICRRLGAPYCVTEMMLDRSVLAGQPPRRLVAPTDEDHPISGQLTGNDPDVMAEAAGLLERMGLDVIDLNFACPVRKALARRRGGYLMKQPDLAIKITRQVISASNRPVTLKLRSSFDQSDRANEALWRIVEGAFDAGAAAVCIHGRSVEAKYAGPADWDLIAAVKRRFSNRTVIGSGDVLRPADVLRMLDRTGVDAVAVARGALGNPWFFRQVRDLAAGKDPYEPSLTEQRVLLAEHFRHTCGLYGPMRGPKIMRKMAIKYARLHPAAKKVRSAFVAVKRPEHFQAVLDEFYADPTS